MDRKNLSNCIITGLPFEISPTCCGHADFHLLWHDFRFYLFISFYDDLAEKLGSSKSYWQLRFVPSMGNIEKAKIANF